MKYHLHIVDSGGAAPVTTSTASVNLSAAGPLLFAHFALRCGHLYEALEVSASTASDAARASVVLDELQDEADSEDGQRNEQEEQLRILRAAASVLQNNNNKESASEPPALPTQLRRAVEDAFLPGAEWGLITPYKHFAQSFRHAEAMARCQASVDPSKGGKPYFSFIAAADLAAYEYVIRHYQCLRLHGHGDHLEDNAEHRPVAVLHVMTTSIERSCQALQRVLEAAMEVQLAKVADLLAAEAAAAMEASNEDEEADTLHDDLSVDDADWLERIEEATSLSSQVLGIDILLTVV